MEEGSTGVTVQVLGALQDGGLPHIACQCARCRAALADPSRRQYAASIAIVDKRQARAAVWLVDATPDLKWQLDMLAVDLGMHEKRPDRLRGIFLTHAHMGHIGGLPQLGPEAMAVERLPLFATPALIALLKDTVLWKTVVSRLLLTPVFTDVPVTLAQDLSLTLVAVPHRDEWGVGTAGCLIRGPRKSLLYVPDIDSWDLWPEAQARLAAVDFALVDASFYSTAELGGRAPVTHPLVPDTLARFGDTAARLVLTHINHTNPILDENSRERRAVEQAGVRIARQGELFHL